MNLITVLLILATGEIAVRISSRSGNQAETVLRLELLTKRWEKIRRNYQAMNSKSSRMPYVIYDDVMGWTIGPNKQSPDGMYWSSLEGIRAPKADVSFTETAWRPPIALVGDSFAFSQDVKFEDSWGYFFEKELDSEFQVLNFGVPGYAVDQAYLRYEKDVRKWKPKIVIFGFIANDVIRSMSVYPFIKFPNWNWPFSKPRFVLRDGDIKEINVPPLQPETIFSQGSLSELPFLEYDSGYKQPDWYKGVFRKSYLIRLLITKFPRWIEVNPDNSNEALINVNALILNKFVRTSTQMGVLPIVAYFPSKVDFASPSIKRELRESDIAKRVLEETGIAYTDLTPCLLEFNPDDRFVPSKSHYSPEANAAIANCLRDVVNESLAQAS